MTKVVVLGFIFLLILVVAIAFLAKRGEEIPVDRFGQSIEQLVPLPTSPPTPSPIEASAGAEPTASESAAASPSANTAGGANSNELKVEIYKEGSGPAAKDGDTLTVHYNGFLTDGTKFDSSLDRNQPFPFVLGTGQVIPGWDRGLLGMKVGEIRRLTIPPFLGYGEPGTPGGPIPPRATLLFEIQLLKIN